MGATMNHDLRGQWALITGASSGLGIEFARQLAARGANLLLAARSEAPMQELAAQLRTAHAIQARVEAIDLAQPGAAEALKARLDAAAIAPDIVINNAGFGLYGDFLEHTPQRLHEMLQLNIIALTELSHCVGRDMAKRGRGHILLVSSIGGYQATPTYAAYSASKAYVLLLGEALNSELKPRGVQVSVLAPGITATRFLAVAGQRATLYQRLLLMQPGPVVATGLRALFRGQASVLPGWGNKATVFSNRFTPRWLQRWSAARLMAN